MNSSLLQRRPRLALATTFLPSLACGWTPVKLEESQVPEGARCQQS